MTDLSWIHCCIHDVHPPFKCCLEWEIMENVLKFDPRSFHIICNIRVTLTGARAFAVFTCTKTWALAAAVCVAFSALLGYESSPGRDKTLYPGILTEQTFISLALKTMQHHGRTNPYFDRKNHCSRIPSEIDSSSQDHETAGGCNRLTHQVFLYHLENHRRVSSLPLFPFVCMNSQLQGESKLWDISLLASPSEMS